MKILGIDYGKKRLGFAVGSLLLKTPTPLNHLDRKSLKADLLYILDLIENHDIGKIVMGLPLNMDGTKGKITDEVEIFCKFLKKRVNMKIDMVDERLTSFEAEEILKSQIPDFKKRKGKLDSMSAVIILNQYFSER